MRCVIVDDEPLARRGLTNQLNQIDFVKHIYQCKSAFELDSLLKKEAVDLIFLDIAMPGMSGIEYLKNSTANQMVIITTAYPEYALESYEFDVIDYLVKPFPFERLLHAVNKSHYQHVLRSHFQEEQEKDDYIFVKSEKQLIKLALKNIYYAESMQNYTRIYTKEGSLLTLLLLKKFAECLPSDRFIRIHKSYLVSVDKIEAFDTRKIRIATTELNIGKAYKDIVLPLLKAKLL